MKNSFKHIVISLLAVSILTVSACNKTESAPKSSQKDAGTEIHQITLNGLAAQMDGISIEEFDYTWHCDPSSVHEDVKNAPAEYYTGTKPDTDAAAYIDQELFYFPALPESGFQLLNYDGEQEWGYYYTDGVNDDYLFATLPKLGTSLPSQMMHSEEEAAQNRVLHITKAGTYALSGSWNGQIWIDLGDKDETFADENAKVTIILDNAQINCTVAPGIVCYSAYECQNTWEEQESYSSDVDLANAGFRVQLAEGSSNSVSGMNVFRMLKTVYKDEASTDPVKVQKKMRKTDGAFYSYVSMVVESQSEDASLQIDSGFEGLDSELYLAINGGTITINSQDDGINVNEDNVSSVMFNGGNITINAALGAEGDGVDSNGFIEINGGTLNINGIRVPDNALDSEDGIYYNGGSVYIDGTLQEYNPGDVLRESGNMGADPFAGRPDTAGGEKPFTMSEEDFDFEAFREQVNKLPEDATLSDVLALLGMEQFGAMERPGDFVGQIPPDGEGGGMPPEGQMPGEQPPEKP